MSSAPAASAGTACFHCGLPIAGPVHYRIRIADVEQPLCCPACLAVAETIHGSGLDGYYRLRDQPAATAVAITAFDLYDRADFQTGWLRECPAGTVEAEWLIGGMRCAACVWLLENHLRRLPGLVRVDVDLAQQRARVEWQPAQLQPSAIAAAIAAIGYRPQPYTIDAAERLRQDEQRGALRRLGVAGLGMMQVGMCALGLYAGAIHGIEPVYRELLRWASLLLAAPVVVYSAQPFFAGAWRGLRAGRPGMDTPVALAIALGFATSAWTTLHGAGDIYFDSVTMFVFLLLGGRYLEMRARHYSGRIGEDLLALLPRSATRIDASGRVETVPVTALRKDDIVLVGDGQTIPADGELMELYARIDEAALTGEFLPVEKRCGDSICAGTINTEQPIRLRVTAIGSEMRLASIHALSGRARQQKPRLELLADRLAVHFVWIVLALATAAALLWWRHDPARALEVVLAVLAVSCPCALGLATPAAIASATFAMRRRGVLATRADVWEKLPAITDVVFDKTGTLTHGTLRVVATLPVRPGSTDVYFDIAAALEAGSTHPMALAFGGRSAAPAVDRLFAIGAGVEGGIAGRRYRLGNAAYASAISGRPAPPQPADGLWLLLADAQEPLCWFRLDDRLRDDAASTLAALRQRGLRLHELSGDTRARVAALAELLGIAHSEGGAGPEQKLRYLVHLQRAGRRVLMVGDGINDLPVLAAADVAIAMQNASELAKSRADCILLAPRLDRLPQLFDTALATRRIVHQNLGWALLYNAVALPLAMAGLVPPWLAAIGMSASSLLVIGNALRLPLAMDR